MYHRRLPVLSLLLGFHKAASFCIVVLVVVGIVVVATHVNELIHTTKNTRQQSRKLKQPPSSADKRETAHVGPTFSRM